MNQKEYPTKEQLTIPTDWGLSVAETDEGPMVLKINSGYKDLMGHPDYSYQIGVAVPLNNPNDAGMHDEEEGEQVAEIEEKLVEALEHDKLALYVFAQTSSGAKEWVFYTGNPEEVETRIANVRKQVSTHTLQNIAQEDPDWETYKDFTGVGLDEN